MQRFRERLDRLDDIGAIARTVFQRHGLDNGFTDRIITKLASTFQSSYLDLGGIIRFMEENIETNETYEVDNSLEDEAVTVQTVHSAKGLEYPCVMVADMNKRHFPDTNSDNRPITYQDPIGLRQKKLYREDGDAFVYDNWRSEILVKTLTGDYDEERRLLYVALTRAENYLILSAEEENEGEFFNGLNVEPTLVEPDIEPQEYEAMARQELAVDEPAQKAPVKLSAHSVMDDVDEEGGGKGTAFGTEIHRFAEFYAKGRDVEAGEESDYEHVQRLIDGLDGDLVPEQTMLLPLTVDGRRRVIEGTIDLLHVTDERAEIIDFKTDRTTRERQDEYRKQLSVYYHAVAEVYPDREITASLFYTAEGDMVEVDPVTRERLESLVGG
jgi:ATP-dependent exoDNAse (exonuclease V) beta subunit